MNEPPIPPMDREETVAFHRGEVAVQSRAGMAERMQQIGGRAIRDFMSEQHRRFFAGLTYVLYGALDASGQPWASLLTGAPGFLHSPNNRCLRIDAKPLPGDPVFQVLKAGNDIGLLGIDLDTRRRNRMNGVAVKVDETGLEVSVRQSFGNCPRFIQVRALRPLNEPMPTPRIARSGSLGPEQCSMIRNADTFFIASFYSDGQARAYDGVDVSHRGGRPGFVMVNDPGELTWPDFAGNAFFNTLGNLEMNPLCGLLFVDFVRGDLLYLTGSANVLWGGPEVSRFAGAERLVRFSVGSVVHASQAMSLRGGVREYSPYLEGTGTWPDRSE